jgi:thiol-disulfide isomerase/thioredoxin
LHGPAPSTRYTHLDGSYHSFQEFSGKPYAVVFWAEWCPYSRGLLEAIEKHFRKSPPPSSFSLFAISIDSVKDIERVKQWTASHISSPAIIPGFSGNALDDEAYVSFQGNDLPHLFMINDKGLIVREGRTLGDLREFLELEVH